MRLKSAIVYEDMERISKTLSAKAEKLRDSTILITGGGGFLGYYFINAALYMNDVSAEAPSRIICLDNFIRGMPPWFDEFGGRSDFEVIKANAADFDYSRLGRIDYIVHAAGIASPSFYRIYPIETMDANVGGLRNLLEYSKGASNAAEAVKSILYLSTSEIYGDPPADKIPTREDYRGNVSPIGPRACYDESKRYGETLCVNFHKVYDTPVKIARPFNNYGPGLSIYDKRVIADFSKNVLAKEDIVMFSGGLETRTFSYVSDAIAGYMLLLLSDFNGEAFNIGAEYPEVSMKDLAERILSIAAELFGTKQLKVISKKSPDAEYLTDNPLRRCPSLAKARKFLGYEPVVSLDEGLKRTLLWYAENFLAELKR